MARRRKPTLGGELIGLGGAAEVMGRRGMRLAQLAATGNPGFAREWQRMHVEKAEAAVEGQWAMWWEAMAMQQRWATAMLGACLDPWQATKAMSGVLDELPRDAEQVLARGIEPARRKVQANRRRLRRS